jgi:enoyl-CoA hydratase/carnithine racemase
MPAELLTERIGPVLAMTLSDPATRNTLSHQVIAAGIEALNIAESDPELRVVILRGAGGHFCAGGNLQGLQERRRAGPPAQVQMLEHLHQFVEALRTFPKPVIAAVDGAAAGAGFSLALACDLIVAAEDARFILSYGRIGLSPDGGATWSLMQALPRQRVQQIGVARRGRYRRSNWPDRAWSGAVTDRRAVVRRSNCGWPSVSPRWRRTR